MNPKEQFIYTQKQFASEAEILAAKYNRLSVVRITTFVLALIAMVYFANAGNGKMIGILALVFPIIFGGLVTWHNRLKYARNQAQFLVQINEEELVRLAGKLSSFPGGDNYQSGEHEYSSDLDVFGRNSLYQLLNRVTTVPGKDMLSKWLLEVPSTIDIEERQIAVQELSNDTNWRQQWQASGMHFEEEESHISHLKDWLKSTDQIVPGWVAYTRYILPVITVAVLVGTVFFSIQLGWLLILLIVNGIVLRKVFKKASEVTSRTNEGLNTLKAFEVMIATIEKSDFNTPLLDRLKSKFQLNGSASLQIAKLKRILHLLNSRSNLLYVLLNFVLLLDVHALVRASKWKTRNAQAVDDWFESMGQLEALSSMAGFAFANPDYTMPIISSKDYYFKTEGLGHPLIHISERVNNDFSIENRGAITVITGSNMSGKSTFLRTLGVNIVLAMMGAPVCATQMEVSRLQIFTGMRTQDNLEAHISSFYAELKRIKQLLDLIQSSDIPVLFMLDEILKGTNSVDRHTGAVALIHQLHKYNGLGLISTHDLDLGKMADNLNFTDNYSFNSTIINNEISFDYKLSHGVCNSFNASKLMKKMGIEIDL